MKLIKIIAAAGTVAAALAMATPAFAQTTHPHVPAITWHATTYLVDRPDSGDSNYWADDYITRDLTITETGSTTVGAVTTYDYTATVTDKGYFTAIKGVDTPNQGAPYAGDLIKSAVSGPMQGYADFSFTATSLPNSAPNLGVVTYENDYGNAPTDSTSTWYELAFPASITAGTGIGDWSWSYHATVKTVTFRPVWTWIYRHHHWTKVLQWVPVTHYSSQYWVDAWNNGGGDVPSAGNISG